MIEHNEYVRRIIEHQGVEYDKLSEQGFFIENPLNIVATHFYRTDRQIFNATRILLSKLCETRFDDDSQLYERILINITDRGGLNVPVNKDLLEHYMPEILKDENRGDLTASEIDALRKKYDISDENLYTGERPKDVTEQDDNLLEKLGGKTSKNPNKTSKRTTRKRKNISNKTKPTVSA